MEKLIIPITHYNKRPNNMKPSLIVLHYISAIYIDKEGWQDLGLILDIFGKYKLSAHYIIERSGRVIRMVHPDDRAWHAGESEWNGVTDCNNYSIGIELVGGDFINFTEMQYDSLKTLLRELKEIYPTITEIKGHEDIAPVRKQDPGKRFDWYRISQYT